MSHRSLSLASLLLACQSAPAEPALEPVDACAATSPVRVAAPPAGWRPDATHRYPLKRLAGRLLYSFDPDDLPERTYWLADPCDGAPVPLTGWGDIDTVFVLDTDERTALYAADDAGVYHFVDRLDVPGLDQPVPLAGLPPGMRAFALPGAVALFSRVATTGTLTPAAGLGPENNSFSFYTHAGDPDRPAVHLGDDIVDYAWTGERMLLLHTDGALRDVDVRTGEGAPLLTGVRHIDLAYDDGRLIWQEIGDGVAETVHLLDLDSGDDREIAVNDFTARSWGRDRELPSRVGTWEFTRDGRAAAFIGPDGLVAAVRTDTGESLPIPAHTGWDPSSGDDMLTLVLPDPDERVESVWTPLTGDLRVYYRGPADTDARIKANDGARIDYYLATTDGPDHGPLLRVDLATGRTVLLAPRLGEISPRLADGRYLSITDSGSSPFGRDLDLFDPSTQTYYPIADDVDDWVRVPDLGVYYFDARGPEPGLWLYPLSGE